MTDATSLVARVADFVATSLDEGVPVVTISRPAHRDAVDALLVARGVDVGRARRDGDLTTLDADESMARFLVDGRPDPGLFAAFVASVMPTGGPGVSAFGEIVAMLWERGEVTAALELESLWNSVIARHPVRLLCAYPGSVLAGAELGDVARMCGLHDHVSLAGLHPGSGGGTTDGDAVRSSVFLPVPAAISSVRGFVRDALAGWGLDHLVGDAVLVTSELATNAVTTPARRSGPRWCGPATSCGCRWRTGRAPGPATTAPGRATRTAAAWPSSRSSRAARACDSTVGGKVAWAELSA